MKGEIVNPIKRAETNVQAINRRCTIGRNVRLVFQPVFGKQYKTEGVVIENDEDSPFIRLTSGTFRKDRIEGVSFLGNSR